MVRFMPQNISRFCKYEVNELVVSHPLEEVKQALAAGLTAVTIIACWDHPMHLEGCAEVVSVQPHPTHDAKSICQVRWIALATVAWEAVELPEAQSLKRSTTGTEACTTAGEYLVSLLMNAA